MSDLRFSGQSLVRIFRSGGFTEASELILPATFGFAAAAVFAALIRLINLWLNSRLALRWVRPGCEAYKRILYQPYDFHVKRNSANVINVFTTQISQTIGALKPFFSFSLRLL